MEAEKTMHGCTLGKEQIEELVNCYSHRKNGGSFVEKEPHGFENNSKQKSEKPLTSLEASGTQPMR